MPMTKRAAAAIEAASAATAGCPAYRPRTTIRRHPERAVDEQGAAILAAGLIAHVGVVDDGQPVVIPMLYHYDQAHPRQIHLHGAHQSRLLDCAASGAPVCLTVALVDALIYSRSALYHSANYRSVVCYGRAAKHQLIGDARRVLSEGMIARYFSGRMAGRDYARIPDEHLDATTFVTLDIEEWSAKARRGGPKGPLDDDPTARGTAGILPLPAQELGTNG